MSSRVTAIYELSGWKRLPWRAIAVGLFASCLSGCSAGLPHSTTWQRVTSPDYMHPEMTLLHGYHRTTWEEWPEHGFRVHYSESRVVEDAPRAKAAEPVPSGQRRQELPKPKTKPTAKARKPAAPPAKVAPEPASEVEVPRASAADAALAEAIAERQRAEDELYAYREAMAREERRRKQIEAYEAQREAELAHQTAIPVEYQKEADEPVPAAAEKAVESDLIALPSDEMGVNTEASAPAAADDAVEADVLESDAVAQRFATLIANDRKQFWSEFPEGEALPAPCEPADDETVTIEPEIVSPPAVDEAEAATPRIIGPKFPVTGGETRLQLRAPTESIATPPPASTPQSGQGEVRLRVSTTDASAPDESAGTAPQTHLDD